MSKIFKSLGILILAAGLTGFEASSQTPQSTNDCGDTISQVNNIIRSRFRRLSASYANRFRGTWKTNSSLITKITLGQDLPFQMAGYEFLACPTHDGSMVLRFKSDHSRAGILRMLARGKAVIAGTKLGDIELSR